MYRVIVIPDTHVKPGVPTNHIAAAGRCCVDLKPDLIVHLGDHWDMASLNSHNPVGSVEQEGKRILEDIQVGNEAFRLLADPIRLSSNRAREMHLKRWNPETVFLLGNHENRINTLVRSDPKFTGAVDIDMLDTCGWKVIDYQQLFERQGIVFSHCFCNTHSDKPIGGTAINRLNRIGRSFVQGHVQGLDYCLKEYPGGIRRHGIVAGSFYQHVEAYRGPSNAGEWRGIVCLNDVRNGDFDLMPLSLDYLLREYA
jgi:hypothetical protein